jgi:amidohydrolase
MLAGLKANGYDGRMNGASLEEHFRWLHRHPELSNAEYETSAYIRRVLSGAGVEILDSGLATGLIARVGRPEGRPKIALRADIDALPLCEETDLEYASERPGVMHACGHDFHCAALIGAALLLKKQEAELGGEVLLVFQAAEEVSGGAAAALKTGFLDAVEEIYGLHAAPEYESGVVALKEGGTFAAAAAFKITISGKGGHAALPQHSRDPLAAAAALVMAAQSIVSRNCDPFDPAVLSFTHLEAGKTWNVLPGEAFIEGTIRSLSAGGASFMARRLGEMGAGIAAAYETAIAFDWWLDSPATNNDPALTRFAAETARAQGFTVLPYTPTMTSEDFAVYQERIPGVFLNFGVGSAFGLHHPRFAARTDHLESAAHLLAVLAAAALRRRGNTAAEPLKPIAARLILEKSIQT